MVQKYISIILRLILVVLFIASALTKIMDVEAFSESLNSYKILPIKLVPLFSYYVPIMEFGLALGFLLPKSAKVMSILTMLVILAFQLALASLLIRGIDIDCACFGKFETSPTVALVRNFLILGICGLLLYLSQKEAKLQKCNQE